MVSDVIRGMTFFIEAKKAGRSDASTIRAGAPNAIHAAAKLIADGWIVSITCPKGERYWPEQFELLLSKYAVMPDFPRSSVADLYSRK